jgi:class 3 adenylate cyclase/tetratricopeptide (TPR) repeat protein
VTNRVGALFCDRCGNDLTTELNANGKISLWRGSIGEADDGLEDAERKQVTVLFADIRNSMGLIKTLDPEAAMQRLDSVLKIMVSSVERFGGVVNQVLGDGVMALFGAPVGWEDHAARGCLAAQDMLRGVALLNMPDLLIRVGLDSGQVVIRQTGRNSWDYGVVGLVAHMANRLEHAAEPGIAFLSERTAHLVRGYAHLALAEPMNMRGLDKPQVVFRLIAAAARSSWEARRSARALSPFVGRTEELDVLRAAKDRSIAGIGQVLTIIAGPGAGKSRLVYEFLQEISAGECRVLRIAGIQYAAGAAYWAAGELVRAWLGVQATDERPLIASSLVARLEAPDFAGRTSAAPFESLLDLPVRDPEWRSLAPFERRHRILHAVRDALVNESECTPLILVIDDYHWIDRPSAAVIDDVIAGLVNKRSLTLVVTRPEQNVTWRPATHAIKLPLAPLGPQDAALLLCSLVNDNAAIGSVRDEVLSRAEGVPLFLEEIAQVITDRGSSLLPLEIPESVQAVIASRVDLLPADHRRLLQIASVIGQDVPVALLKHVTGIADCDIQTKFASLCDGEFLRETPAKPGVEYTFKHSIIQAVCYESMLLRTRRDMHLRVLSQMESLYRDRLEEFTDRLADHAWRGESWDKAALYGIRAGDRAILRWAWREAIPNYQNAIHALARLDQTPEVVDRAIEARLRLRVALPAVADLPRIASCLDEARQLAVRANRSKELLVSIDTSLCLTFTKLGQLDRAINAGRISQPEARRLHSMPLKINANFALAQAYWYRGDFAGSEALLAENLPAIYGEFRARDTGTTGTASVLTLVCYAKTCAITGRFERAKVLADDACRIAELTGKPFDLSYARVGLGFTYLMQENFVGAIAALEHALDIARASDIGLLIPSALRYLGRAYTDSGREEDARLVLEEVMLQTTTRSLLGMRVWSGIALSNLRVRQHDPRAVETLRETFQLARMHRFWPAEVQLCLISGLWCERSSFYQRKALIWYKRALARARTLGMSPDACKAELALVSLGRGSNAGYTPGRIDAA